MHRFFFGYTFMAISYPTDFFNMLYRDYWFKTPGVVVTEVSKGTGMADILTQKRTQLS